MDELAIILRYSGSGQAGSAIASVPQQPAWCCSPTITTSAYPHSRWALCGRQGRRPRQSRPRSAAPASHPRYDHHQLSLAVLVQQATRIARFNAARTQKQVSPANMLNCLDKALRLSYQPTNIAPYSLPLLWAKVVRKLSLILGRETFDAKRQEIAGRSLIPGGTPATKARRMASGKDLTRSYPSCSRDTFQRYAR